jgi:hypothetical protein
MSDGSVRTCEYDGTDWRPLFPSFKELTEDFHNRPDEHPCECDCEDEPQGRQAPKPHPGRPFNVISNPLSEHPNLNIPTEPA